MKNWSKWYPLSVWIAVIAGDLGMGRLDDQLLLSKLGAVNSLLLEFHAVWSRPLLGRICCYGEEKQPASQDFQD